MTQNDRDRWADWMIRHPKYCIGIAAVLTVLSLTQIHQLKFDDDFRNLFRSGESRATLAHSSENDLTCLVMVYGKSLVTAEGLTKVNHLHTRLAELGCVKSVNSMLDARRPKRVGRYFLPFFPSASAGDERLQSAANEIHGHPMLDGQLLTRDGDATLLLVHLSPELTNRPAIQQALTEVRQVNRAILEGTGFEFELTGLPVVRMALFEVFAHDQWAFNLGGALIAILVSAMVFRSALATVIILSGPLLGVVWTMAAMAYLGQPLNIVNGMIGPLTLAIGLTAAVHMMFHFREQSMRGESSRESALSTLRIVAPACGWAALTTILGFLSLASARLQTIQNFGLLCALAVALTFAAVLFMLPALCSLMCLNFVNDNRPNTFEGTSNRLHGIWMRSTQQIIQRPGSYCMVGCILIIAMLAMATNLEPAIGVSEALPAGGKTLAAWKNVEARFGGVLPVTLFIQWSPAVPPDEILDVISAAHQAMDNRELLSRPLSLVSLLTSLPGESLEQQLSELKYVPPDITARFLDSARRQSWVFSRCKDAGSNNLKPVFAELALRLKELERAHPEFHLDLTEVAVESVRVGDGIINDLARSLLLAVPLISVIMIVVLRSWRLGIVSMIPNLFPLAATAACIVLLGWNLRLFTVTLFAIFFGIAVDDTIHILLRFQTGRQKGMPVQDAILEAMKQVGPAVITTTLVLSAGMSVLMTSQILGVRHFGFLFCCGLFFALVGDLVLLPASLAWIFGAEEEQSP